MSVLGALKKVGKVALMAAPYVAAPFTGGASLMATGLANSAVNKWSQHDAKVAESKGLAPSSFDRILGKVGDVSSIASMAIPGGALGKIGMLGKAAKTASTAAKVGDTVSKASKVASVLGNVNKAASAAAPIMGAIASGRSNPSSNPASSGTSASSGSAVPRATSGNAPGFQYGTNNPNLADSLLAGRQNAVRSQPFRSGYDITRPSVPNDPHSPLNILGHMPQIPSDFGPTRNRKPRQQAAQ